MEAPERLGKYLLTARIAVGGMAEIYKARTAGLGGFEKVLAIKRLHARYSQDSDFIKMLIDEAKIAVQLSHTNIAQTFDLDRLGDHYFICMEYVDGRDMHRLLRRLGEHRELLPLDLCCYMTKEVCAGLDYAHRKMAPDGTPLRIIHRDISPQNVLLSWEGEVKIVDFGVAKAARRAYETESGIIKGKFYYMSPEQARNEPLDHRSDIFSLGVVAYEALTGRLVYTDAPDNETLMRRVREARIVPPSKARREIPKRLDQIIMRALARDREERYQSAAAFGDALTRFLQQVYPRTGRVALASFMRRHFDDASVASEPVDIDRKTIMSRVDYQAQATSLIYDGSGPGPESFDDDPFFSDASLDLVGENGMSAQHPPVGNGRPRGSEVNVIDDADIEIIDENGPTEVQYEGPPDDVALAFDHPFEDQVTNVRRGDSDVIDDLGTLDGGGLNLDESPYGDLDDEPTRVFKADSRDALGGPDLAPQALLAASPDAEHGPLRGESRVAADATPGPQEEPTVITSIDSILPPAKSSVAQAPRPRRREGTHPRAVRGDYVGYEQRRTSPVLIAALFLIVLAVGAGLAFGIQLLMREDTGQAQEVAAPTEIPQPGEAPARPAALSAYYVTSHPTGARVLLDGEFVGITPTTVEGLQVDHTYGLRLEYDGHRPHEQPLRPNASGQHSIAFTLDRLLGTAIIQSTPPNAAISLNGNFVQNAPVTIPGLDTRSSYVVAGSMPGYLTAHERLEWAAGSTEPIQVNLVLTPIQPDPAMVARAQAEEAARASERQEERTASAVRTERSTERTSEQSAERTASRESSRDSSEREESRSSSRSRSEDRSSRSSSRDSDRTSSRDRDSTAAAATAANETASAEEPEETTVGRLSVLSEPEAHVFIDGSVVSTQTPLMNFELDSGTHRVKVYYVSLRRFSDERRVRVVAGETRSVRFDGEE